MSASTQEAAEPTASRKAVPLRVAATNRQVEELWFALARTEWTSLAIVPVDEGQGAADVAQALAEVGSRVRELPVRAFTVDSSAFENSIAVAAAAKLASSTALQRQGGMPGGLSTSGQVIFTVEPIMREPLGMAVLQSVDAVLLFIQMGHTRLDAARRTLKMIGRERVGCVVMHGRPDWGGPR
jgi:hypothetical protein